jgi:membrane protein YdbS with pleckstrin-like domain
MNIVMVGSGYVGLVSGACFADFGHNVTCVDKDARKIEALQAGRIPIYEPGLAELVAKNMKSGQLAFTTELDGAVAAADAVFIAVGTPTRRGDGHADLSYVHEAAREIARAVTGFTVVVTKSTVPVGTGDSVERIITETNEGADVAVASNPEFLREGAAITDFKRPDRIVVGSDDPLARAVMNEIYRPLFINASPMMFTTRRTAELIKYYLLASLAAGPGLIVLIPLRFFRYRTLRYEFDNEGMTARWGLLFRREVSLTYARIQDIHLVSNIVERWFGLGRVEIQTASGKAGAEMTIEGLPDFEHVRDQLYLRMRGARGGGQAAAEGPAKAAPAPEAARDVDQATAALREAAAELRAIRELLPRLSAPEGRPDRSPGGGA